MQYQHKSQISSVTPTLQMEDLSKPQIIHSLTSHLNGKDKPFMGSCSAALAATFCLSETRVTLEKKKKNTFVQSAFFRGQNKSSLQPGIENH